MTDAARAAAPSATAPSAAELADDLLDAIAVERPVDATFVGIPGHDHELPDLSEAGVARLRERAARIADQAAACADPDRVTVGVVRQQAESMLARLDARTVEFVLADAFESGGTNPLAMLPQLTPTGQRAETDHLTRLAAVPDYYAALAERHRTGLAAGRLPVDRMARNAIAYVDRFLAQDPNPLLHHPLTGDRAEQRARLVAERVLPALAGYRDVLAEEVLGRGRPDEQPGLCWLPDGAAHYAALARQHTTTDHTPEQLHRIGLDLIAALDAEYREVGGRAFGLDTAEQVRHRLRTDPALLWRDAEEMLAVARAAVARASAAAPAWFRRLPLAACEVRPVPDADAPVAAPAYYIDPAPDGSRPGIFFTNTHEVTTRTRFIAEAVAFHEAVPGHHFQIATAQELTGLPLLRTLAPVTSYQEGWALYTERLADEMGLYSDDVMRLGMLAEDSVRAARLVVDTGLHALGWTRQQCVDYLRANTVLSEVEVQSETDRYIECPGQALSYMVGRLEIQRLRGQAEAELGSAFDLRDFHDVVLGGGPLPLSVLADVVRDWVATTRGAAGDR
ncbi:DUF885 domain-containing protein [Goodfellowiella coeruleoviolacea]|uniref:DUF885 domain-containing protein n=1 Tax=Goodfellowiella coeruleoviolacea TaxID=334858 RepID=UPI0020A57545|nr:DUF885 domain-containing protein [Goodfellowiella coeruleoviolacea]